MENFSGTNSTLSEEGEAGLFGDLVTDDELLTETAPEEVTEEPSEEAGSLSPAPEGEAAEEPQLAPAEEVSPPGEETASSDSPVPPEESQEDIDWKKRYNDLRTEETRRMNAERDTQAARQTEYEQMLAAQYAAEAPVPVTPNVDALAAQAQAAGIDPEAIPFFVNLAQALADEKIAPLQAQLAQQQVQREAQMMSQDEMASEQAKAIFKASHSDITAETEVAMVDFLAEIGAGERGADGRVYLPSVVTPEILDIALESIQNPSLGTVLRAQPELYESDEGLVYARQLASALRPTTQEAPQVARSTRDSAAELAAAETLGGPSAPPGTEEEELFVKTSSSTFFSK